MAREMAGSGDEPETDDYWDDGGRFSVREDEERRDGKAGGKSGKVDLDFDDADASVFLSYDKVSDSNYLETSRGPIGLDDGVDYEELLLMSRRRLIHDVVMDALWSGEHKKKAVRSAVKRALRKGARFTPAEVCDLSEIVKDEDTMAELIATSDPWFMEGYALMLDDRWKLSNIEFGDEEIEVEQNGEVYEFPDPDL